MGQGGALGHTLHPPCVPSARAAAGLPGVRLSGARGQTDVALRVRPLQMSLNFNKTNLFKSSIGKVQKMDK